MERVSIYSQILWNPVAVFSKIALDSGWNDAHPTQSQTFGIEIQKHYPIRSQYQSRLRIFKLVSNGRDFEWGHKSVDCNFGEYES